MLRSGLGARLKRILGISGTLRDLALGAILANPAAKVLRSLEQIFYF